MARGPSGITIAVGAEIAPTSIEWFRATADRPGEWLNLLGHDLRATGPCALRTAEEMRAFAIACQGKRASPRRRPRRVQRKIDQRGGYLHHDSLGAYLHAEEGRSHGQ